MSNAYTNTRIEFHILQSFPVTCLNRDDVGAPKTAVVGGVTRARVSSQCWKRAVRLALNEIMPSFGFGIRTKRVKKLISEACFDLIQPSDTSSQEQLEENIDKLAERVSKILDDKSAKDDKTGEFKTSTLIFLGKSDAERMAQAMQEFDFSLDKLEEQIKDKKQQAKEAKKDKDKALEDKLKSEQKRLETIQSITGLLTDFDPIHNGIDIALFGRMVANAASMNVEAAASFAHAISTHRSTNEVEFFTALDDLAEEPGSAHMGSLEFNSATYYRYISLDLGQLAQTLGAEDLAWAVEAFVKALYIAVPSARQATMSGAGSWDFARVLLRRGQRLQASFDAPVKAKGEGYAKPSMSALKDWLERKEKQAGSLFGKLASHDIGERDDYSVDDLIADLKNDMAAIDARQPALA